MTEEVPVLEEYKFGFHDNAELVMSTGTGLTEDVIRTMSAAKRRTRMDAGFPPQVLRSLQKLDLPEWGLIYQTLILMMWCITKTHR